MTNRRGGDPYLIGVDVGTTRLKAVVVDPGGGEHAAASSATPWSTDGARTDVDADLLADEAIRLVLAAWRAHRERHPRAHAVGIGVTGMAESGVLIDRKARARTRIVAWHDPGGDHERLRAACPDFERRTGLPIRPVPSIMKLPSLLAEAGSTSVRWLNVPEWIVVRLGGVPFTEISLAGRTGLVDLDTGARWSDGFEFLGRSADLFVTDPGYGTAGAGHSDITDIAGAHLVVAGHDHQVAAYAETAIGGGRVFESLGTADAILRSTDRPPGDELVAELVGGRYSIGHAVFPGHWIAIAGLRTGHLLQRVSRLLGLDTANRRRAVSERSLELRSDGVLRVFDRDGALAIDGIGESVEPASLWRAVVDSTDAQAAEAMRFLDRWFGPADDVTIAGGWLNDPAVAAVKRARFGAFRTARSTEPGAVGAAVMAGVRAGVCDAPTR